MRNWDEFDLRRHFQCCCISLLSSFAEPLDSEHVILRNSTSIVIHTPETILSCCVSLHGGLSPPLYGKSLILRNPLTSTVGVGQVLLRPGIPREKLKVRKEGARFKTPRLRKDCQFGMPSSEHTQNNLPADTTSQVASQPVCDHENNASS